MLNEEDVVWPEAPFLFRERYVTKPGFGRQAEIEYHTYNGREMFVYARYVLDTLISVQLHDAKDMSEQIQAVFKHVEDCKELIRDPNDESMELSWHFRKNGVRQ